MDSKFTTFPSPIPFTASVGLDTVHLKAATIATGEGASGLSTYSTFLAPLTYPAQAWPKLGLPHFWLKYIRSL